MNTTPNAPMTEEDLHQISAALFDLENSACGNTDDDQKIIAGAVVAGNRLLAEVRRLAKEGKETV